MPSFERLRRRVSTREQADSRTPHAAVRPAPAEVGGILTVASLDAPIGFPEVNRPGTAAAGFADGVVIGQPSKSL
jgi:hypothetical protein